MMTIKLDAPSPLEEPKPPPTRWLVENEIDVKHWDIRAVAILVTIGSIIWRIIH